MVKGVSFFSYPLMLKRDCVTTMKEHFFGAFLLGAHFLCAEGVYMNNGIPKKIMDITGVELIPGESAACLGNGKSGFECCCDECDFFALLSRI